jgi:hypothetical protein
MELGDIWEEMVGGGMGMGVWSGNGEKIEDRDMYVFFFD